MDEEQNPISGLLAVYDQLTEHIQQHHASARHLLGVDDIHEMRVQIKRLCAFFKAVGWIIPNFREDNSFKPIRKQLFDIVVVEVAIQIKIAGYVRSAVFPVGQHRTVAVVVHHV